MSSATQILEDVKNGKCSIQDAQVLLSQIKIEEMKTCSYKISPKGAISFYGIRRMPITLYSEELDQIVSLTNSEGFKQFIIENKSKLSTKENKK